MFVIFFAYQVFSLEFVKFISNIFYFTNSFGRESWKERDLQVSAYLSGFNNTSFDKEALFLLKNALFKSPFINDFLFCC